MRPKQQQTTGSADLFRARLDQIINMKHELVQLAAKIDWRWIDGEVAPLYSDKGRPGIATRFVIGLLMLKHIYCGAAIKVRLLMLFVALYIYGLSDEGVCERWVGDAANAILTAVGHNLHLILVWLRMLLGLILIILSGTFTAGPTLRSAS